MRAYTVSPRSFIFKIYFKERWYSIMSIKVTVGKIPGVAKEVTLDGAHTIAEALRIADLGSADGYEIRLNNAKTADFNAEVQEGDIVSMVKSVKGNTDDFVSVTVDDSNGNNSTTLFVEKGTYVQGIKSLLPQVLPTDYKAYDVDGNELESTYEINDDMVIIFKGPAKKKKAAKSGQTKETSEKTACDTISCTVEYNGKAKDLILPKGSRYNAIFKELKLGGSWSDYAVTSDSKLVKFSFATVKNQGHIVICKIADTIDEIEDSKGNLLVRKEDKTEKKVSKKKLTKRKSKEQGKVMHAGDCETVAMGNCSHSECACHTRPTENDVAVYNSMPDEIAVNIDSTDNTQKNLIIEALGSAINKLCADIISESKKSLSASEFAELISTPLGVIENAYHFKHYLEGHTDEN